MRERLALVQKVHDLMDRGVDRSEIREAAINSPHDQIQAWFEAQGVGYLIGQVDSIRRTTVVESPWEQPRELDEDGIEKPLVDIPPVVNPGGETLPSKLTTDYAEARAVRWAKTTSWEGRYLWDALDDIDWLLTKIEGNRRKASGILKTTNLIEDAVSELKAGTSKDEVAASLREGWQKVVSS